MCILGAEPRFVFLSEEDKRRLCLNRIAQTAGLINLVLFRQTSIFECEHPFIDKPMVITEPAVKSTRVTTIRPWFEFMSWQYAVHAQLRSFPGSLSYPSMRDRLFLSRSVATGRRELWERGWTNILHDSCRAFLEYAKSSKQKKSSAGRLYFVIFSKI